METNEMREKLKSMINEMLAVEILEYHDKNLLSGDNKSRSEYKQKRLMNCLSILDKFALDSN